MLCMKNNQILVNNAIMDDNHKVRTSLIVTDDKLVATVVDTDTLNEAEKLVVKITTKSGEIPSLVNKGYDTLIQEYLDRLSTYKEKWKPVILDGVSYPYEVSNHGRLKKCSDGSVKNYSYNEGVDRYHTISIFTSDKKRKSIGMHRLVCIMFCKIPQKYLDMHLTFKDLVPNHINGIKKCNAAFNLDWTTIRDNTRHAFSEGLCDSISGENNHLSKMNNRDAHMICALIQLGKSNDDVYRLMNKPYITRKMINHIRYHECWTSVSRLYRFPKLGVDIPSSVSKTTIRRICTMLEIMVRDANRATSDGKSTYTIMTIAKYNGVSPRYVRNILVHQRHTDISKNYSF